MIRRASLVWLLLAVPAAAHGNLPGGGGFASGFAHPFVATEHALAIAALGLLCGRTGQLAAAVWLIIGLGAGFALFGAGIGIAQAGILGLALVAGLMLAFALAPPPLAISLGAVTLGLFVGLETDRPVSTSSPAFAYVGAITAALLIFLNSMAIATWLGARWNRVPLRVAGAWIAAAAMLILAFVLRGRLGLT